MEPANHFTVLRRYWRLLVGCTLAALAVGWVLTPAGNTVDNAKWQCKVAITPVAGAADTVRADQVLSFASGSDVATAVAKQLAITDIPGLLARRTVAAVSTEMLVFTTTGPTQQSCADLAAAFATATVKGYSEESARSAGESIKRLEAQAATQQAQVDQLQQQFSRASAADQPKLQPKLTASLNALTSTLGEISKLQNYAQTDAIQQWGSIDAREAGGNLLTSPSRSMRLALAVGLGLSLGVVAALMLSRMDTRLRTRNGVEEAFNLPVIGEIPQLSRSRRRLREPLVVARPSDPAAEAYRSLRSTLLLTGPAALALPAAGAGRPERAEPAARRPAGEEGAVVLVAAARSQDGRTTTVANLAAALAETGLEVLVLDCDFRHPQAHAPFGLGGGPGMAELLSGEQLGEPDELIRPTGVPGVRLITGGNTTAYPAALVLRAGEVLRRARRYADLILIDTSPLLHANDAYDLVQHADAVLVTVRAGNVTPEQADRVSELLARTGVPVAGVALLGSLGPSGRRRRGGSRPGLPAALGRGRARPAAALPGAAAPALPGPGRAAPSRARRDEALERDAKPGDADPGEGQPREEKPGNADPRHADPRPDGAPMAALREGDER
ncbi:tyrosine-protein kinase family protein [Kitasatospora sp. NPDC050543]|uniref:tyrosine-protein kinase family protein n=1 Tax=Kitasatospora sp. NPDC050543 TaxID=3364054 RepID=UPI0037AFCCD3